jgi:hypothetical protein
MDVWYWANPACLLLQLNAFEDGNIIHMDMLTYNDSSIFDKHMFVENLLSEV